MRKKAALLLLMLSLAATCRAADRDFGALEKKAETLRGLKFSRPVPTQVVDGATLRKVLDAQIRKEYPDAEWPAMEKTLKAFSLIPRKMNLKAVMSGLLEEQVVGLYDPDAKRLYVNSAPMEGAELLQGLGGEGFDLGDVYVLHEMVHALTDQAFDLKRLPLEDRENEDRASAARCVVEGDATWVMMRYLYDALKVPPGQRGNLDDVVFGMNLGRELMGSSVPAYLQDNLLIAYLAGQALVKMAYERGGFEGVNRLYTRPPESMEQVLHPEKYFEWKDHPVSVRLVPPKAFAEGGWKRIGAGVWGELNERIILQEWGVPEEQARRAVEGWGGDAYAVYESPAGTLGFAWATVWDSEPAAAAFVEAAAVAKDVSVAREGRTVTVARGLAAVAAPSKPEELKKAS